MSYEGKQTSPGGVSVVAEETSGRGSEANPVLTKRYIREVRIGEGEFFF